MSHMFL